MSMFECSPKSNKKLFISAGTCSTGISYKILLQLFQRSLLLRFLFFFIFIFDLLLFLFKTSSGRPTRITETRAIRQDTTNLGIQVKNGFTSLKKTHTHGLCIHDKNSKRNDSRGNNVSSVSNKDHSVLVFLVEALSPYSLFQGMKYTPTCIMFCCCDKYP